MNTDFSKYKKFIDSFSSQVTNVNFDTLFNTATKNITKSERFLLKMELKRLATPCSRLIDLRGHVDGECHPYEHEGRIHYLDEIAQETFEIGLSRYGQYTVGVYEATTSTENNYRVMYQNEKSTSTAEKPIEQNPDQLEEIQDQYSANFYRIGDYFNRSEERLNYATSLHVTLADNSDFDCKSVDLSVSGCRFRLKTSKNITLNQTIYIRFIGLLENYSLTDELFPYSIKTVVKQEGSQLIGAVRAGIKDSGADNFSHFLATFIAENKRRYKINLDNTIKAVKIRTFEQYIVPKTQELPVFLARVNNKLTPKYVLRTKNNRSLLDYWQNEKNEATLSNLITLERLAFLKQPENINNQLIVFSFIHEYENRQYFYTADNKQLAKTPDLMQHYLAFASSKKTFAVTSLKLHKIDTEHLSYPFTSAGYNHPRYAHLTDEMSSSLQQTLSSLPYVLLVTDLTHDFSVKTYQHYSYNEVQVRQLKTFGHKRSVTPEFIENIEIDYQERRQEARFKYKTPIILEKLATKRQGELVTFSLSGLKVSLHQPVNLKKGANVKISLPSLQKLTKEFNLVKLTYEVVHVNSSKKVISLKIPTNAKEHISPRFFQQLMKEQKDKLFIEEDGSPNPSLASSLRNIYSHFIQTPWLMIQTSGSRYKIDTLVASNSSSPLLSLMKRVSDNNDLYNLYPLLHHPDVMLNLTTRLKKMQPNSLSDTQILFIAAKDKIVNLSKDIRLKIDDDFQNESQLYDFISRSLEEGTFLSLMIKLSRVNEPSIEYLAPELNYVSSYAIHQAKQLERTIWSLAGVAQLIDITDEVLFRFQLSQPM